MTDQAVPRDPALPDGVPRNPADFRISFTDQHLVWAGESRPGLPVLHWPDGTVCEPLLLYFGWSAEVSRVSTSSMRIEACAIREFIAFLWRRGKRWDQASNRLLREWREEQRGHLAMASGAASPRALTGRAARRPSSRQVERKIVMVVELYRHIPEAICSDDGAGLPGGFVGPSGKGATHPITTKTVVLKTPWGCRVRVAWIGTARQVARQIRKPILGDKVVARVLAALRGQAVPRRADGSHAPVRKSSLPKMDRDWLIGRCKAEAGLRCEEITQLSLTVLARALAEEGVGGRPGKPLASPDALSSMASDAVERERVLQGLEELRASGRRELGVEVSCKARARKAPIPVALVIDLLEIGIWTVRDAQVQDMGLRTPSYAPPPVVFLSSTTGQALRPGSVGDSVKRAFDAVGVLGSAHRLRAYFGTTRAVRLLEERLALNGFRYDEALERAVLVQVADAMGHADWSTTVAYYVDRALMRLTGVTDATAFAGMIKVHRALLFRGRSLGREDFVSIETMIERLPGKSSRGEAAAA